MVASCWCLAPMDLSRSRAEGPVPLRILQSVGGPSAQLAGMVLSGKWN